ncbi:MAG: hypothetical protein HS108_00310 [Planctomycetes bacterium]|jgi:hypothetical protein|nr:hypothetical protein [Planctomycetota bacterium]MCL4729488.1 hypothetical protein [Planctomycetota bacterium]
MATLRIILGVIGGYAAMAALIMVWAFVVVVMIYPELAPVDGKPVYPPLDHPGFVAELPVNLVAGFLGGLVCALIAGAGRKVSVAIMIGLMLAMSLPNLFLYGDVKPLWANIAAPILGITGVLAGYTAIARGRGKQA